MKFTKKDLFTIPNILTYIRFACVPIFIGFMAYYAVNSTFVTALWVGFGVFVFASATDIADGFIARRYHMISDIGKVIDPIADKLLQVFAMIMLVVIGNLHWAFMTILLIKEIAMGVLSRYLMVASKCMVDQKSNFWGKAGASVNFVGIVLAFFAGMSEIVATVDLIVLCVGSAMAIVAFGIYNVDYLKQLKELRASGILDTLNPDGSPMIGGEKNGASEKSESTSPREPEDGGLEQ